MRERLSIDPDCLEAIVTSYPEIGDWVGPVRNGLSINTATCLFETTKGLFFAKRYDPRVRSEDAITAEHDLIMRLLAVDYPTPPLFRNQAGSTLTWLDGFPYAIFAQARGEDRYGDSPVFDPYGSPQEAHGAGRQLAAFHLGLKGVTTLEPRPFAGLTARYELLRSPDFDAALALLLKAAPTLADFVTGRSEWPWVVGRMRAYHGAIAPLSEGLPIGITHGDFIKRNLFWQGDNVSAVIDFDLWNLGPWLFDLALALLPCGFNWPELLHGRGIPRWDDMRAMIGGYQAVRTLTDQEHHLLPLVMESARFEFYLSAIASGGASAETFWRLLVDVLGWFETHPLRY